EGAERSATQAQDNEVREEREQHESRGGPVERRRAPLRNGYERPVAGIGLVGGGEREAIHQPPEVLVGAAGDDAPPLELTQDLCVVFHQVGESRAGAAERERQQERPGHGGHHGQRGATTPADDQPNHERRGDQVDRGGRDERRRGAPVPPVQIRPDTEQAEHQDDLVDGDEVHVVEEELQREHHRDRERPRGAVSLGMQRIEDALREDDGDGDQQSVEDAQEYRRRLERQQREQLEHHPRERRIGGAADPGGEVEQRLTRQEILALEPEGADVAVGHRLARPANHRPRHEDEEVGERQQRAPPGPEVPPQDRHGTQDKRRHAEASSARRHATALMPGYGPDLAPMNERKCGLVPVTTRRPLTDSESWRSRNRPKTSTGTGKGTPGALTSPVTWIESGAGCVYLPRML